ncbi:RNA polymerase sigma factor SigF [Nocardia tengchongensis]|uniref:RNA polymerase sigma factor SigF n=1 Tax=Nocardia tengchongensis TaxID=2055889 RepID=A0ABX8CII4_9NOCA|nr:RNA polymerase sigma factor SigF [Nocardia tengchongensis]QVI19792.1 RNA polymerase sigma factor SigF [Nocardia tengchongensis]
MSTTTDRSTRTKRKSAPADSYDNIEPRFSELAAMADGDSGRPILRNEILQLCMPLADHIARRFAGRGQELDDLQQVARLGLIQAVDRFDVSRGSTFLAFAVPTIMGEVRRHFRDHAWAVRVPRGLKEIHGQLGPATDTLAQRLGRLPTAGEIATELAVEPNVVTQALVARNAFRADSLDRLTQPEEQSTPSSVLDSLGADEPCYQLTEDAMTVRPLIAQLPERERTILILRYFESQTQAEIAHRMGVSQMQISRILSRTLQRLHDQALGPSLERADSCEASIGG